MIQKISNYLRNYKLYRLLLRISQKDPDALETLYHDYSAFIFWHIMNYVQDKETSEDILQEVFIKLYVLDPKNVPHHGATSWLIRVIHNTTITYLERQSHRTAIENLYSASKQNSTSSVSSSPEDEITSALYVDHLLNLLDPITRNILSLRYQGYSFKQISEKLHLNCSTIRSRYTRAIHKLKKLLEFHSKR